jgi:hypothetical protein
MAIAPAKINNTAGTKRYLFVDISPSSGTDLDLPHVKNEANSQPTSKPSTPLQEKSPRASASFRKPLLAALCPKKRKACYRQKQPAEESGLRVQGAPDDCIQYLIYFDVYSNLLLPVKHFCKRFLGGQRSLRKLPDVGAAQATGSCRCSASPRREARRKRLRRNTEEPPFGGFRQKTRTHLRRAGGMIKEGSGGGQGDSDGEGQERPASALRVARGKKAGPTKTGER